MNKHCRRTALLASLVLICAPIAHSGNAFNAQHEGNPSERQHTAQQWLHALGTTSGTWQPVQTLTWFGRPLWLRQFAMTQGLGEAAQQLTRAAPALDRILTGPDTLLLSGMAGRLHFVVQLQRAAQGISGVASVLDASSPMRNTLQDSPDSALAGLHQDTRIHAAQWRLPDGLRVRQFIHVVPQMPDQLRARLHTVLARQGWWETPINMRGRDVTWQRHRDYIHLMADRGGQGSVLYQVLVE